MHICSEKKIILNSNPDCFTMFTELVRIGWSHVSHLSFDGSIPEEVQDTIVIEVRAGQRMAMQPSSFSTDEFEFQNISKIFC